MTDPATAPAPARDDAASATPFQVIGSDDAGYCVDGVCILPADRDVQHGVDGSAERVDDRGDAKVGVAAASPE